MRFLYIFPHPDDESFGPAPGMARPLREGHEVHLLALTRGGATKQRHRLGLSVDEMGEVRLAEMKRVEEVLGLSGMQVLDLPDSGLAEMDPREIEEVVHQAVLNLRPDILVTYAVHGISGFRDHLVTHAVVKRVYCELRAQNPAHAPRRLALFTLAEPAEPTEPAEQEEGTEGPFTLSVSPPELIDAGIPLSEADLEKGYEALACYETYQEVIERADPLGRIGDTIWFELFGEAHDPPLGSLEEGLEPRPRRAGEQP
jgi:N-acetylglucosamine malate deacetylase 2